MEQPPTYASRCGSSPWRDYKYNKSTSNAVEEEEADKTLNKNNNNGSMIQLVIRSEKRIGRNSLLAPTLNNV